MYPIQRQIETSGTIDPINICGNHLPNDICWHVEYDEVSYFMYM